MGPGDHKNHTVATQFTGHHCFITQGITDPINKYGIHKNHFHYLHFKSVAVLHLFTSIIDNLSTILTLHISPGVSSPLCCTLLQCVTCWGSGITPGGRVRLSVSVPSCPPLSPPARDTRVGAGDSVKLLIHSDFAAWNTGYHQCCTARMFWFARDVTITLCRTGVNRCITDANGAALQLETINVSTWILINLQNSIYHTCCYPLNMKAFPKIDIPNPVLAMSHLIRRCWELAIW